MYYLAIAQCTQAVRNVESWLNKAEEHAAAKNFDVGVLMTSRLAPDMKPFIYQVQSACDYLKAAAAWLSGQKPPKHEDTEQTIDEVRARIRKTVAFVESMAEAQYAGAAERRVSLSFAPAGKVPNLAAPMLVAMERARTAARANPRQAALGGPDSNGRPAPNPLPAASAENIVSAGPSASSASGAEEGIGRTPMSTAALAPPRVPAKRPIVVIDPGHGGHDPGAQAPGIVAEKDAALAIAMRLRNALAALGVDARLTRDDDTFLSLAERTQMANRANTQMARRSRFSLAIR